MRYKVTLPNPGAVQGYGKWFDYVDEPQGIQQRLYVDISDGHLIFRIGTVTGLLIVAYTPGTWLKVERCADEPDETKATKAA